MAENSCGCEMVKRSALRADPIQAEIEKETGEVLIKEWNCPFVCNKPPSKENLTDSQKESFVAASNLTGISLVEPDENNPDQEDFLFETCPNYYYNGNTQFGNDAVRASRARKWKEDKQLNLVEDTPLPNSLVEAIEFIDNGFRKAEEKLYQIRKEKQDSEFEAAMRSTNKFE